MEAALTSAGQQHVLAQVPNLAESHVLQQLSKFDIAHSVQRYRNAVATEAAIQNKDAASNSAGNIAPVSTAVIWSQLSDDKRQQICNLGWRALSEGKVAAVIMSGGQGTRLGFSGPKGMYDMSLPSQKTIFQLHIEKIIKVQQLAHAFKCGKSGTAIDAAAPQGIPVYIMTSDLNDATIRNFFREHNFFGYPEQDIFFFEQGLEPCFTLDGRVIFDGKDSLSMAPDGNGGIYNALQKNGAMDDMTRRGVEHLHIYGIDNILTKSLDPGFIGAAIEADAQCANKVVPRAHAGEKVGVTAVREGKMCIIEYCEIPPHLAGSSDASGRLVYGAANICNHYLTLAFLKEVVLPRLARDSASITTGAASSSSVSTYHVARKKIPFYDPSSDTIVTPTVINGIKLELFIFDVFPLADRWMVLEVERQDEFAPVKNEPGNPSDSPDTARAMMSNQARRWLEAAGCSIWEPPSAEGANEGDGTHGDPSARDELRGLLSSLGVRKASDDGELPAAPAMRNRSITQTMDLSLLADGAADQAPSETQPPREVENIIEISPLLSYAGEGLEAFRGAIVKPPCYLE